MTYICHANMDGSARAPSQELRGKRRSLRSLVNEVHDYRHPVLVSVMRKPELLRYTDPNLLGLAVSKPERRHFVSQKDWSKTTISNHDVVTFVYLPAGGGGGGGGGRKQGLGIAAAIAAIVITLFAGPIAGFLTGTVGLSLIVANTLIAGVVIGLNYLAQRAAQPKANKEAAIRPLYGVSGGGNVARPGDRIPVIYGRIWTTPLLSQPDYYINEGDTLRLYKRMTIGCGKYALKKVRVGTYTLWENGSVPTDLQNSISVELINPGAVSRLVPASVATSNDVSGIELPRATGAPAWAGPFRVAPQGIEVTKIQLDYSIQAIFSTYPDGHKRAGTMLGATAGIRFQYAVADANGNPASAWTDVPNTAITGANRQPQRLTRYVDVAKGQYIVRAQNTQAKVANGENGASWDSLRGWIANEVTRSGITEIAITVLAGAGLSINSFSNIECEVSRILPARRGGTFTEIETSKSVDAFADIARNTDYGGAVPDSIIDWAKIEAYATQLTQFDTYDGQINGPVSLWEALSTVLGPMRAEPRVSGVNFSFVRDEPQIIRKHNFTRREILSSSTSQNYKIDRSQGECWLKSEYNVDGDPKRRQEATAIYGPQPIAKKLLALEGVKEHGHATHLTRWAAAAAFYRYKKRKIDVELAHRLVRPGDVCGVDAWYITNACVVGATAVSGNVITIDVDPIFPNVAPNPAYAMIRDVTGREYGPISVTISGRQLTANSTDLAQVEASTGYTLAQALGPYIDIRPASIILGTLTEIQERWIVQRVTPKDWRIATIEFINDAPEVWAAIGAVIPPLVIPPSNTPTYPTVPTIPWVRVTAYNDSGSVGISWAIGPALGSNQNEVEISYDEGETWASLYRGIDSQGTALLTDTDANSVRVRARAFGEIGIPSAWVMGEATIPVITENPVSIENFDNDTKTALRQLYEGQDRVATALNEVAHNQNELGVRNHFKILDLKAETNSNLAVVRDEATVIANDLQTVANRTTNVETSFGEFQGSVNGSISSLTAADTAFASNLSTVSATANAANTAAGNAQGTANTALTNAATAQATATSASNAAATANNAVGSLTTSVNAIFGGNASTALFRATATAASGSNFSLIEIQATQTTGGTARSSGLKIGANDTIGFVEITANQFFLTDPNWNSGARGNIFTWSSADAAFTFNVPVKFAAGVIKTENLAFDAVSERKALFDLDPPTATGIAGDQSASTDQGIYLYAANSVDKRATPSTPVTQANIPLRTLTVYFDPSKHRNIEIQLYITPNSNPGSTIIYITRNIAAYNFDALYALGNLPKIVWRATKTDINAATSLNRKLALPSSVSTSGCNIFEAPTVAGTYSYDVFSYCVTLSGNSFVQATINNFSVIVHKR